jgi:hypothetical protein
LKPTLVFFLANRDEFGHGSLPLPPSMDVRNGRLF